MNEVFQAKSHLHFGAIVFISCFSNNTKFYMYSNGISFKSVLSIAETQSPHDPSRCLFVIKPTMKFQSESFLENILLNRYNEDVEAANYDQKKAKSFIDQFEFELNQNIKLKEQQQNFPIKYNENFMLQHVFSSSYLSFAKNPDSNEYSLYLSDIPSSNCVFNLKACFNYQKDINTYVPFNSGAFLNVKFQDGLHLHEMNLNFVQDSIFDSWLFSEESQDKIKIELYQTGEEIEYKNICFGDTVWIFHLQSGSFAKVIDESRTPRSIILKKIQYSLGFSHYDNKTNEQEAKPKIMIQKAENEMSAQKFGLWQIVPVITKDVNSNDKGKFVGGRVKFDQQVRFLNAKYRTYLSVRRIKKGRNKFEFQYAVEETEEQNTVFRIKSLSSNSNYVTTEDLFLIQNLTSNTYLTLSVPFAVNETQAYLSPSTSYKKQDNFKFTKIDFLELWQNNYLLSTMPFIREGINALKRIKDQNISVRDEVLLRLVCENLIQILSFSFDLTEGFEASQSKLGKMTYNHFEIQKLLKQQGVILQLIELLKQINPDFLIGIMQQKKKAPLKLMGIVNVVKKFGITAKGMGENMKKVEFELLQKIVNTSLKILRNCCKSNTQNSLLLFKNSQVIIKFLSLGTYAEQFIIDSFCNPIILEKIGADQFRSIIDQYINIFKITNKQTEKIFVLLSKLIKYEDEGIGRNQLEVFRLFFIKDNPLMIPIKEADHKFYVNGIQLNQFCSEFPDIGLILGYQIKFCAEITSNRNYICSKNMKQWFPLPALLNYLIENPVGNHKIKQSFVWLIIHSYLNERPRFKRSTQLIFSVPDNEKKAMQQQNKSIQANFEVEMEVMRGEGLSANIIDDIFSCIRQGDQMTQKDLQNLKKFIVQKIQKFSDEQCESSKFYTSKTQGYIICLKYLVELEVFQYEEIKKIEALIEKIAKKMDQSLTTTKSGAQKLQSKNFRQLLLQMVQKNVIKKFNFSANFDGVQDEVSPDNICSIFVNYSFYQNILLAEKDSQRRKQTDSVIKIVLELIEVYGEIRTSEKIKKFTQQLSKPHNMRAKNRDRNEQIKSIILGNMIQPTQKKQQVFNLLSLIFYNSNTYKINSISINRLLSQIFADRLAMEKISKLQFNVDERQREQYKQIEKNCKNIKLLIETSQIWLNMYEISKSYRSKFDAVILLFMTKLKQILKTIMPEFDDQQNQPLFGIKYSKSVIAQKQQIIANLKVHEQVIDFITQYRPLMLKIKSGQLKIYNSLLIPLFKFCFLFLYAFIFDSPENKKEVEAVVKESYLRDYSSYVDKLELGETMFVIQYLKNNYQHCIQFYQKNPQIFQKYHKFTATHSKLLLTVLSFYNEPIQVNLQKFYISIFDFTSLKSFLWFKPNGTQLNLDPTLFQSQPNKQPYIYHIHAIGAILKVAYHIQQSRNTIRQHIKKSLSQQYLYGLLFVDDYYSKQNSNNPILKVMIHFKSQIMKLIQFAYFSEESKNDTLILNQFRRQHAILTKFIAQAPARQENQDFRRVVVFRDIRDEPNNKKINQLYQNFLNSRKGEHILQAFLNSIDNFSLVYKQINSKPKDTMTEKMVMAAQEIHQKVATVYQILHQTLKNFEQSEVNTVQKYPVPFEWLFSMSSSFRDEQSLARKRYFCSFLIQSIFSKQIYTKFRQNEMKYIQVFKQTLKTINIKPFLFLRKLSQFFEDAFEKLSNNPTPQMYKSINLMIRFMTLWIQSEDSQHARQFRCQIGKSQLIFPILNFFQICPFDKSNKELFLVCLQFFNQLIGEEGNKNIQTIFNQYFTNKADSIQFFMKVKELFNAINFQDRANYKCKKIYDSVQQLSKDTSLEKQSEFIILNFFIRLCKGNFKDNQTFLSSLSNVSSFNIMSGIWEILRHQSQKYKKNLINVQNYKLITQCFSTVRELVQGPCVQNQNQFLKREFFLTVLEYFQFQPNQTDLTLEKTLEDKLEEFERISTNFTQKLRIYLNRDKITESWMPSQVKYRCISLICSLMSQNISEESKNQLYTLPISVIVNELDKIHSRYIELGLEYTYENLEVKQETEIILPLGFKLYELLQYYPVEKIPKQSAGLNFFRQNSRVIQVLHQKLTIVVFPRIPDQISDAFKSKFIHEVDRSSVNSKLRGLQDSQVQNKQSDYPYGYILLLLVVTITILDIILYNKDSLQYIQLFNFYPIFRLYGVNNVQQEIISILIVLSILCCLIFLMLEIRGAIYFRQMVSKIMSSDDLSSFEKFKFIASFLWNNLTYFHYFIALLLCFLTIFNPFFDAILLLVELYRRSQTFSAIVDAITSTLDQLLVVMLFTLICTYVLTTFLYYYRAITEYPDQCQKLYNCFVFSLDMGFRQDAGIAGWIDDSATILQAFATKPLQDVLINFIYLFIIKIIIDQIIGAIIVDKFAALRQNQQKLKQDEDSFCFICGLGRTLLDREQDGFDLHKQQYHNMWNYFQFLIYLRKSKLSNLSGIQLFVYDEQKRGKLNWFPISRSYHMQMKNQESNEKQEQQNELQKMMKLLDGQFNQLRDDVNNIWNLLNVKLAKDQVIAKQ